jgi:hypothetical protein
MPDHEQHSCLALIEINSIAISLPGVLRRVLAGARQHLSLATIARMVDALVASEGEPDLIQLPAAADAASGILRVLDLVRSHGAARHDQYQRRADRAFDFAARFVEASAGSKSTRNSIAQTRGADGPRRGCAVCARRRWRTSNHNVSTTLVCTVKRGTNDDEIGEIVRHALQWRCVRGVTFQPVQDVGRNENFDKSRRIVLSEIRRRIVDDSGVFGVDDMVPLPCNPETISMGYGLRNGSQVMPVTSLIPREEFVAITPNTISFEKQPILREKFIELFSLSSGANNASERLAEFLCCLPKAVVPEGISYENVFRVAIVQFMDRFNFDLGGVKRSCIHFITPNGQIIPFDTYNLFYRNGQIAEIRSRLAARQTAELDLQRSEIS